MKIELPDFIEIKKRKADNRGRVAIGSEYSNQEVTVLVFARSFSEKGRNERDSG